MYDSQRVLVLSCRLQVCNLISRTNTLYVFYSVPSMDIHTISLARSLALSFICNCSFLIFLLLRVGSFHNIYTYIARSNSLFRINAIEQQQQQQKCVLSRRMETTTNKQTKETRRLHK